MKLIPECNQNSLNKDCIKVLENSKLEKWILMLRFDIQIWLKIPLSLCKRQETQHGTVIIQNPLDTALQHWNIYGENITKLFLANPLPAKCR